MIRPAVLNGVTNAFSATNREVAIPEGLWNRGREGVLIHTIKFRLDPSADAIQGGSILQNVFGRLEYGNEPITEGHVALGIICQPVDRSAERPYRTIAPTNRSGHLQWRLSKPIYLPRDERIKVSFRTDISNARSLSVTAVGVEGPPPKTMHLPYVSAFHGAARVLTAGATFREVSSEADLNNPFPIELQVDRFVSRAFYTVGDDTYETDQLDVSGSILASPRMLTGEVYVRIVDHKANVVVPRAWHGNVFNLHDRSWLVNAPLSPRGFFIVTHEGKNDSGGSGTRRIYTGMIGYRRIGA